MKEFERARWRCRRGMLELDIILQRFMDKNYCQLNPEELSQFERLLSLADNDLWDLVCDRQPCAHRYDNPWRRELRFYAFCLPGHVHDSKINLLPAFRSPAFMG